MLRVLRPGGRLVVPTFCHDQTLTSSLVSRVLAFTGFPGHRRFKAASFRAALEEAHVRANRFEVIEGLIPICYADGLKPE